MMSNTLIMALILIVFAAFMGYLAWDSYQESKNHSSKSHR